MSQQAVDIVEGEKPWTAESAKNAEKNSLHSASHKVR